MYTIDLVSMCSILLPVAVGAFIVSRMPSPLKLLFGYLVVSLAFEAVSFYYYSHSLNNMFLFHLHTWVEFGFIVAMLCTLFTQNVFKLIALLGVLSFVGFSVYNLLYLEPMHGFNSNQRIAEVLVLGVLFLLYLFELANRPRYEFIENHPFFILAIGYLIYLVGTLCLFVFSKQILAQAENWYWAIHGVLNILLNATFALVLWKGQVLRKHSSY